MAQIKNVNREHHKIVIVGGGTAGIITASLLRKAGQTDVAIIEPSSTHFYQPIWTLVGAGVVRAESSARSEARYIPRGVRWIQDQVEEIDPDRRCATTKSGTEVEYDFLVIAAGAQIQWDAIPGLNEAIRRGQASSNYSYELAPRTWELIRNFKGGTALFHMPGTPIKCPGAPQKIMYLAADYFRKKGIHRQTQVIYGCAQPTIYGAKDYAAILDRVIERYGIDARFQHDLVEVVPDKKEAVFQLNSHPEKPRVTIPYDILHAAPPESAPDFIRRSPLADPQKPKEGWVQVNKVTLQHINYPNVFALGDAAGTPNAKTAAAAVHQAPVVAANLLSVLRGAEPAATYDGYIACPIVTSYRRMLLCELDYSGKPSPRIPVINTFRERYDMWLLKRYGLPWLYWNVLLRGWRPPFVGRGWFVPEEVRQEQLASQKL